MLLLILAKLIIAADHQLDTEACLSGCKILQSYDSWKTFYAFCFDTAKFPLYQSDGVLLIDKIELEYSCIPSRKVLLKCDYNSAPQHYEPCADNESNASTCSFCSIDLDPTLNRFPSFVDRQIAKRDADPNHQSNNPYSLCPKIILIPDAAQQTTEPSTVAYSTTDSTGTLETTKSTEFITIFSSIVPGPSLSAEAKTYPTTSLTSILVKSSTVLNAVTTATSSYTLVADAADYHTSSSLSQTEILTFATTSTTTPSNKIPNYLDSSSSTPSNNTVIILGVVLPFIFLVCLLLFAFRKCLCSFGRRRQIITPEDFTSVKLTQAVSSATFVKIPSIEDIPTLTGRSWRSNRDMRNASIYNQYKTNELDDRNVMINISAAQPLPNIRIPGIRRGSTGANPKLGNLKDSVFSTTKVAGYAILGDDDDIQIIENTSETDKEFEGNNEEIYSKWSNLPSRPKLEPLRKAPPNPPSSSA